MKIQTDLTIIIPTLNNVKGLSYLKKYFSNKPYNMIIVDNKKKNLGFAGGVNKGAENTKTKWMLILNDDIEFQRSKIQIPRNKQDAIKYLIQYAEEKKLDAVSPILRNPNGEAENFGYKLLPIGKIQLIKKAPNYKFQVTNKSKMLNTKYKILDTDIDGITAACLLVKTKIFKKIGGFDEKFFAYLEDVDFFLRLAKLKTKPTRFSRRFAPPQPAQFAICPDVEVLHNHMTTTKTMGNFKARQDMVNWWRLYFKHPDKFKLNFNFIIERLRNVSGYLKATFRK